MRNLSILLGFARSDALVDSKFDAWQAVIAKKAQLICAHANVQLEVTNPRFEHQQFDRSSTIRRRRPGATHSTGSTRKAHAIPGDQPEQTFDFPICRGCNAAARCRSLNRQSSSQALLANRGLLLPSFSKSPVARTAKTSQMPILDFPAGQR